MTDDNEFDLEAQLIAQKSIRNEARKRLDPYEYETVSPKLREDYEDDGWELDRENKRTVRMKRAKPHDGAFEDRVWATMAQLNFVHLNADRNFRIPYGRGEGEWQQVDVFAADAEIALVVECRSTQTTQTASFKKEVEAISGQKAGIVREIRNAYPAHKVKFVLATNNHGVTPATRERFRDADIVHMDEDAIDYYLALASHLGNAARYQLLGNLFAGKKIPGLSPTVPAIQAKMGGYTYYSFMIEPARLLKLGYILHRNKANNELMPTYQRLIKKSRLKKVADFVENGGVFPNSIILNLEKRRRPPKFEPAAKQSGKAKLGLLHLPQTYRAAFIIDGQHRLYGYADSNRAESDLVPVVAFVGLDGPTQVQLFMQINENQKAVPKNLRNTLNADLLWDSPDLRDRIKALQLYIAAFLGEDKTSPLYGRVIIGENTKTETRCLTIDAVRSGLQRGNFLGTFTKDEMKEAGTFYLGANQPTFGALTPFLVGCFRYIIDGLPEQWELGSGPGGFVFINSGVDALLRIMSDIVDHLAEEHSIKPTNEDVDDMVAMSTVLLEPLIEHLGSLTPEEGANFRRQYGSGGAVRYWRELQCAIHAARSDFVPGDFVEYQKLQAKLYNERTWSLVQDLERFLNEDIQDRLKAKYGTAWLKKGLPVDLQKDATVRSIEKNQDADSVDEVTPWECLYLIDYQKILRQEHALWQELFADDYTRPEEEDMTGGWKKRTDWLSYLNEVRNNAAHGRAVSEEDYEFVETLADWLLGGTSTPAK